MAEGSDSVLFFDFEVTEEKEHIVLSNRNIDKSIFAEENRAAYSPPT
ncbi:MAG TPA: hypothetical protein PK358_17225 [Spirochaetota bacterium]|nr:hypothetical protein [Spirochaetota bacterium]